MAFHDSISANISHSFRRWRNVVNARIDVRKDSEILTSDHTSTNEIPLPLPHDRPSLVDLLSLVHRSEKTERGRRKSEERRVPEISSSLPLTLPRMLCCSLFNTSSLFMLIYIHIRRKVYA